MEDPMRVVNDLFTIGPKEKSLTFFFLAIFFAGEALSWLVYPVIMRKTWERFSKSERMKWVTINVSSLHCVILFYYCWKIFAGPDDELLSHDVFSATSHNSIYVHSVSCAYFIWDVQIVLRSFPIELPFVFHGVVCLANYWIAQRGTLHYYGYRFLLFELSTPLLNIRYAAVLLIGEHSKIVAPASMLFGLSFLGVRLLWGIPTVIGFVRILIPKIQSLSYDNPEDAVNMLGWTIFATSSVLMSILNIYWMYSMIKEKYATDNSTKEKVFLGKKLDDPNEMGELSIFLHQLVTVIVTMLQFGTQCVSAAVSNLSNENSHL